MPTVPTLTTPRFTLRPLRRSDAAALLPTLSDAEQCRYLSREAFASEDELWAWLADPDWPGLSWIAAETQGAKTHAAKTQGAKTHGAGAGPAEGDVVARLVAVPTDGSTPEHGAVFEIGYITVMHRQGEGVARECARALITHLLSPDHTPPVRKLTAEVDVRNAPSIALIESLGFTREATLREADATHIGLCDVHWYGLLAREWEG
ncbi:MAG: GNAT family protein [Pseudomonadota bacterium]